MLSNAIKYSPKAKRIHVELDKNDSVAVVKVQDFGIGIPKQYQRQIFQRFFRITGPRGESFPGMGIGLYISSKIVERHDGKLSVESTPNKGSLFIVELPLYKIDKRS